MDWKRRKGENDVWRNETSGYEDESPVICHSHPSLTHHSLADANQWQFSSLRHLHQMKKKRKFAAHAMKRVTTGAQLPSPWHFLSLQNAQTIQPTTAWTAVSSLTASAMYSFLHLSMEWGALYGRKVVRARPNDHYQRTGAPSSAD